MKQIVSIAFLVLVLPVHSGVLADESKPAAAGKAGERGISFEQFVSGGKLFRKNCATCHGELGQGSPNWQRRGPDGKYPAPPLNGTGHTWHHSVSALTRTIRDGTLYIGGSMPPWKEKLSDKEIADILGWIILQWPDEIYNVWRQQAGRDTPR